MRYFQFNNFSTVFFATVRVILHDGVTTTRTTIKAKTLRQAKLMLIRLYGEGNVLKLSQVMSEHEDIKEASKTLSPQELQVKSLDDKAKQYKDQAKAMKARQQIAKAQQDLMKANRGPSAS
jgi:hypothetical protein